MTDSELHDDAFERGHVVWHDGVFGRSGRPWLVLSGEDHPFAGEEYVATGITTTDRPESIELDDGSWALGGLPKTSFVSPWFLTTIKHADVERGVGALTEEVVETVVEDATDYLRKDD